MKTIEEDIIRKFVDLPMQNVITTQGDNADVDPAHTKGKVREQDPNNTGRAQYDYSTDGIPQTAVPNPQQNIAVQPHAQNPNLSAPLPFKVDITDAVGFIKQWESGKASDMRPALAEETFRRKAENEYFMSFKQSIDSALQNGQTQIAVPVLPASMMPDLGTKKEMNSEENDYKKMMAAFSPLIALKSALSPEGATGEPREKTSELLNAVVGAAKEMRDGGKNDLGPTDPTATAKAIIDIAKDFAGEKNAGQADSPVDTAIKLVELVRANAPPPQSGPTETVDIQNPDGSVKRIPIATYLSELAIGKRSDSERSGNDSNEQGGAQVKLLSSLVATVEQLSNNVVDLERRVRTSEDPDTQIERLLAKADKWEGFKQRFLGNSNRSKEEIEEENDKKREHELELKKIEQRKVTAEALARAISVDTPTANEPAQPSDSPSIDELLEMSRQKGEHALRDLSQGGKNKK